MDQQLIPLVHGPLVQEVHEGAQGLVVDECLTPSMTVLAAVGCCCCGCCCGAVPDFPPPAAAVAAAALLSPFCLAFCVPVNGERGAKRRSATDHDCGELRFGKGVDRAQPLIGEEVWVARLSFEG